ncbi:isochorismatase family protein [Methanobacterium alcaliphilum]|nr:isochorismatase family protein [Methanobacterium alcaliphilum]
MPVTYPENSFKNILKIIDAAFEKEIPVILIQHTSHSPDSPNFRKDTYNWEIHEEILQKPYNLIVEKHLPGSFTGTPLEKWLRNNEIEMVTISGYMSQMCCDTTARQAMHRGFGVEFISDATGTLDISNYAGKIKASELHKSVLITQAMRFSKVLSTKDWIKSLK